MLVVAILQGFSDAAQSLLRAAGHKCVQATAAIFAVCSVMRQTRPECLELLASRFAHVTAMALVNAYGVMGSNVRVRRLCKCFRPKLVLLLR